MELNINNYEMYFLLYADNELCLDEMKLVEDFVLKNPVLKREFEITLSSKISPDEDIFQNKIDLFKFNGTNLRESLLLHLDNENVENSYSLDELIKSDPKINKEWNILKSTKLDKNDEIVFANKSSLYRHEAKTYSLSFLKYAVAAVLIGLGLFFGIKFFTGKIVENNIPEFANTNKNAENNLTPNISKHEQKTVIKNDKIVEDINKINGSVENENRNIHLANKTSIKSSKDRNYKNPDLVELKKEDDKLIAQQKIHTEINIAMLQENNADFNKISSERKTALLTANKIETNPVKNIALAAVSNSSKDDNIGHVFIINEEKVNHSKAAGLFNKVKKFVNKTTNLELPDHLSVGNYEIAIK